MQMSHSSIPVTCVRLSDSVAFAGLSEALTKYLESENVLTIGDLVLARHRFRGKLACALHHEVFNSLFSFLDDAATRPHRDLRVF